jgi:hypothetical protein
MALDLKVILRAADETADVFARFKGDLQSVIDLTGTMGGVMALAGAGVTAPLEGMVEQSQEYVKEVRRAAAQTGIATQVLYGLRYAAKESGVEFDSLTAAINRQARAAYAAAKQGGAGEQDAALKGTAEAYQRLGVSVMDSAGNLKAADVLFLETAQALREIENPALRSALATTIFGRGSAELLPLLNKGQDGIAGLMAKAKDLGLVLTDEATNSFAKYGQAQKDLDAANQAIALNVGSALTPALAEAKQTVADLTGKLAGWANQNPELRDSLIQVAYGTGWVVEQSGKLLMLLPDLKAGLDIVIGLFNRKAAAAKKAADAVAAEALASKGAGAVTGGAGPGAAAGEGLLGGAAAPIAVAVVGVVSVVWAWEKWYPILKTTLESVLRDAPTARGTDPYAAYEAQKRLIDLAAKSGEGKRDPGRVADWRDATEQALRNAEQQRQALGLTRQQYVERLQGDRIPLTPQRRLEGGAQASFPTSRQRVDVNVQVNGSPEMMRELLRDPAAWRAFEDAHRRLGRSAAYGAR